MILKVPSSSKNPEIHDSFIVGGGGGGGGASEALKEI